MSWLFALTVAGYAVASALLLVVAWAGQTHLAGQTGHTPPPSSVVPKGSAVPRAAVVAYAIGWLAQTAEIGVACLRGLHPLATARDALGATAWFVGALCFFVWRRQRLPILASLLTPLILVLYAAARLSPTEAAPRAGSLLGSVHILFALFGLALFAIAAGSALVYLWSERGLRQHRGGRRPGTSLEALDKLNRRAIGFGFPVFSVAIVSGAMWWAQLRDPGQHLLQLLLSLGAWLIFAVLLVMRVWVGLRGRRSAQFTVAGFASALAVLVVYVVQGAR